MEEEFKIHSEFKPSGDQPEAIRKLTEGINDGLREQVLLGVTGSGKTFTIANVIQNIQRPALVIAHNKTLAAQLCNEFREFFPENRVEFFVSYYDYYQPEAYIPRTDTYIEKELEINDEIDKLRNSATSSLCESDKVIVVASVSCIYGLGLPIEYFRLAISLRKGDTKDRDELIRHLVEIQYKRADLDFVRATFRVRGDMVDIIPASMSESAIRIVFFGDEVEHIYEIDILTGKVKKELSHTNIFPASHYVVSKQLRESALEKIASDMEKRAAFFESKNKFIEAQRIRERVSYDIEMIREMGYCNGIENYSCYFDGRKDGQAPYTLMDFFPSDFVTFIDESHMTLPQLRAMYNGDRSRKDNLIEYGFRLPTAYNNRPLRFEEFDERVKQMVCISATPAKYELSNAGQIVEQIIRPTGLLDPEIFIKPVEGQIDSLIGEINQAVNAKGRVLITTLTKKMAESLTLYLKENHIKAEYMHSDIDTLERVTIINKLREGEFDVLVGINLLREGLDLPEVRLVCILDADKEGFLRSESSLIQTIGRAARNSESKVIMYADTVTDSMKKAIDETNRRRKAQKEYNEKNGIIPKTIIKKVTNTLNISEEVDLKTEKADKKDIYKEIERLTALMKLSSASLDFESAIKLRDEIAYLKKLVKGIK